MVIVNFEGPPVLVEDYLLLDPLEQSLWLLKFLHYII